MIGRNVPFERELIEQRSLFDLPMSHHDLQSCLLQRLNPNCSSMTSLRQIEANRHNALKSTGAITAEGKGRSRCNAVRHGLTAETVIAVLECSEDYEAFEATVLSDYNAETAVEQQLGLRLASVLWRLRRATSMETAILDSATATARLLVNARSTSALDPKPTMADSYLQLSAMPSFPLDRLSRYESTLWRQARQIIFTFESLRWRRRKPRRISFPFPFRRRATDFVELKKLFRPPPVLSSKDPKAYNAMWRAFSNPLKASDFIEQMLGKTANATWEMKRYSRQG